MATDWNDPCAKAAKLTEAYYALIQGESEAQIQYMANGKTRMVMYNKADLTSLKQEMQSAQAECEAKNNGNPRPRRSALQFG